MKAASIQRFWAKVDKRGEDECWPWLANKLPKGYGTIRIDKRRCYAHRVSYELHRGPIPEGMQIDHLCRNPGCVNPAHLEVVTPRENVLRGNGLSAQNARKTHCPKGHPLVSGNIYRSENGRRCRECHLEHRRKYVAANLEKVRAAKRSAYRAKRAAA
jgi:hypothetical protein